MPNKKKQQKKLYTPNEVKEKFFPNQDWEFLKPKDQSEFSREAFFNILKKVAHPPDQQTDEA